MKKLLFVLSTVAFLGTACTSKNQLGKTSDDDDIYYSSSKNKINNTISNNSQNSQGTNDDYVNPDARKTQTVKTQSDNGGWNNRNGSYSNNGYYDNTPFNYDDYYDYSYSARLRRFHGPYACHFGYYDDFYTNSYWYTYNPYHYGLSIYMGYHWWGPSYYYYSYCPSYYYGWYDPWYSPYYSYPHWNWGWSWGWGCGYHGWGGYGPYYGYGYNYNYWGNLWNGYYNGCYNNYYYNWLDHGNFYYGPRTSPTASNGTYNNTPWGHRYENITASTSNGVMPVGTGANTGSSDVQMPKNIVTNQTGVKGSTGNTSPQTIKIGSKNEGVSSAPNSTVYNPNLNNLPVPKNNGQPVNGTDYYTGNTGTKPHSGTNEAPQNTWNNQPKNYGGWSQSRNDQPGGNNNTWNQPKNNGGWNQSNNDGWNQPKNNDGWNQPKNNGGWNSWDQPSNGGWNTQPKNNNDGGWSQPRNWGGSSGGGSWGGGGGSNSSRGGGGGSWGGGGSSGGGGGGSYGHRK